MLETRYFQTWTPMIFLRLGHFSLPMKGLWFCNELTCSLFLANQLNKRLQSMGPWFYRPQLVNSGVICALSLLINGADGLESTSPKLRTWPSP